LSLSSLLSPPVRGFNTTTGTFSGSVTATATPPGRTQLSPSDFANTFSSAFRGACIHVSSPIHHFLCSC
jgi:hypothetical protein